MLLQTQVSKIYAKKSSAQINTTYHLTSIKNCYHQGKLPQSLSLPETNIDMPETNIDMPETNIDMPETNIDMPETNIDMPETNIDMPKTNIYAQNEGVAKLGLTEEQVLANHFSFSTIRAIEAELKKPNALSLNQAFELYKGLDSNQVLGISQLGLSRQQVLVGNFSIHTIYAIENILKVKPSLSSSEAWGMVKEMSSNEVDTFFEDFMLSNRKKIESLWDMHTIRVVVNIGDGFGHQRAAITLMQKLRDLGFNGVFDVWCDDRLGRELISLTHGEYYINTKPIVSANLIAMLPDLHQSDVDSGKVIDVSTLGKIKISSIPKDAKGQIKPDLPCVTLGVSAGNDSALIKEDIVTLYNVKMFLQVQPTDWHQGFVYVVDQNKVLTSIKNDNNLRLSSADAQRMPDVNTIRVNTIENEIIGIISNPSVHTQLVYGLIPSTRWSIQLSSNQPTGNLDEVTEMKALIAANLMLIRKTHKPIVLFLPQNIAQKYEFIQNLTNYHNKVGYCDLTKGLFALQLIENSDIIIVHTGPLQSQFFDYLLLKGTTLPPVIEGCNSRELCEFAGRSFIYGSSIHAPLKEYPVVDVEKQKLHKEASACLKTGDPSYLPQLVQYMNESLTSDPKLVSYHKQRQAAFLARPDAVEVTLGVLGIECRNTLSFQFSQKIQVLPSLKSQVKKNKAKQKSRKCCVLL